MPRIPTSQDSMKNTLTNRRRQRVAEMFVDGVNLSSMSKVLESEGIVNQKTKRAYNEATLLSDLREVTNNNELTKDTVIKEIIGRYTYVKPIWAARVLLNVDRVQQDYIFWDNLRRGKARGFEYGGLFALAISQILTSYILGEGITAQLTDVTGPNFDTNSVDYTNSILNRWYQRMQGFFSTVINDGLGLGDQYILVNPDTTTTVLSPETVTVQFSPSNPKTPVRYIVRVKMERAIATDIYEEVDGKCRRILNIHYLDRYRKPYREEYDIPIGRLPIVHFANECSNNEIYGRPVYERLLPVFSRMDDLFVKMVDGAELVGNPIPVFNGLENINETKAANSTPVTYTDIDGTTQVRQELRFDRLMALFLGKGGSFDFASPQNGFTGDMIAVLTFMFKMIQNTSRIAEFMWGAAIASSKASAEVQLPPFIMFINMLRLMLEGIGADNLLGLEAQGGLLELNDIFLKTYALLNPSVVVAPTIIKWPSIDAADDAERLGWATLFSQTGYVGAEDIVALSEQFEDPASVVARANNTSPEVVDYSQFDNRLKQNLLQQASDESSPPRDDYGFIDDLLSGVSLDPSLLPTQLDPSKLNDYYSLIGPALWHGMP